MKNIWRMAIVMANEWRWLISISLAISMASKKWRMAESGS
jgi:hypothetical protein